MAYHNDSAATAAVCRVAGLWRSPNLTCIS